ncbi:MAG: carboxypeptidase-like regulatory domain-containing protein [Segetibacter sp.]
MKKSFLTFFIFFLFFSLQAQDKINSNTNSKITGKIIDSISRFPVEYATITLFAEGNKKAVNGTTTDKAGSFAITDVGAGIYTIVAEFIGYKPYTINNIRVSKK